MTEKELKALESLIEYVYKDEEKSFLSYMGTGIPYQRHIFNDIEILREFLNNK